MNFSRLKIALLSLNAFAVLFAVAYLYATGGPIPGGDFPEEGTYLFHEKFAGSVFSSLQIAAIGALAFMNAVACHFRFGGKECCFWLASAFAFVFFAFDEYYLIHENMDRQLIRFFDLPKNSLTDKIDDLIVLVYGLAGLFILRKAWPWLKQHAGFLRHAKTGFVLLFLMVLFDVAGLKFTPVKELEEDALKVFAEAFFLLAYAAPLFSKGRATPSPSETTPHPLPLP